MAYRLIAERRLLTKHTLQFPMAEIDPDGILILDLRTATISKQALAWDRRREAAKPKLEVGPPDLVERSAELDSNPVNRNMLSALTLHRVRFSHRILICSDRRLSKSTKTRMNEGALFLAEKVAEANVLCRSVCPQTLGQASIHTESSKFIWAGLMSEVF